MRKAAHFWWCSCFDSVQTANYIDASQTATALSIFFIRNS